MLSLLGHHPTPTDAGFDQPDVVGVNARADGPPSDSLGGDELLHLGLERNAECAPAEPRTRDKSGVDPDSTATWEEFAYQPGQASVRISQDHTPADGAEISNSFRT